MKFRCRKTAGAPVIRKCASVTCLVLASIALSMPAYAIQDGRLDGEDHPNVGMIVFYNAKGEYMHRCSGTLIAPNVVLTAAHCTAAPAARAQVFFKSDLNYLGSTPVLPDHADGHMGTPIAHPEWMDHFSRLPQISLTPDIGAIILDKPVEGIVPATITSLGKVNGLVASNGSKPVILDVVGYGLQYIRRTPKGLIKIQADRVRHRGEVTLQNINSAITGDNYIQHSGDNGRGNGEGATSFGDSGGPVFLHQSNEIVALTSFGLNFQATGPGFAYRVDTKEAHEFIDSALEMGLQKLAP
jgi:hypothetical protein